MKREGVDERERKREFNYEVRACMYSLKARDHVLLTDGWSDSQQDALCILPVRREHMKRLPPSFISSPRYANLIRFQQPQKIHMGNYQIVFRCPEVTRTHEWKRLLFKLQRQRCHRIELRQVLILSLGYIGISICNELEQRETNTASV